MKSADGETFQIDMFNPTGGYLMICFWAVSSA